MFQIERFLSSHKQLRIFQVSRFLVLLSLVFVTLSTTSIVSLLLLCKSLLKKINGRLTDFTKIANFTVVYDSVRRQSARITNFAIPSRWPETGKHCFISFVMQILITTKRVYYLVTI